MAVRTAPERKAPVASMTAAVASVAAAAGVTRYQANFPMHVFAGWQEGTAVVRPVSKGELLDCWPDQQRTNADRYAGVVDLMSF